MTKEHTHTDECGFDRNASLTEDRYVCMCGWRDNNAVPFEGHTVIAKDRSDPHTSEGGTLKPCPFCGQSLVLMSDHHGEWWGHEWNGCHEDVVQIHTKADADRWNRRSAPAAGMVPVEIDCAKHRHVLDVWNECMMNCETLEMAWPKLVKAIGGLPQQPESTGWSNLTCDACGKRFAGFHKLNRNGDRCCPECAEAK